MALFTIGHSTRSLNELAGLLHGHGVTLVVDVRTAPGSRRLPHFSRAALAGELPAHGIGYLHLPELGGLRRPRHDSPNAGWRNASFRGYADHMATEEWRAGLERLLALSEGRDVAFMCAEAVPWRCHRSLIADALLARGVEVRHVLGSGRAQRHEMTRFARVDGERVWYPAGPDAPEQRRLL